MERMTYYDDIAECYKIKSHIAGRSIVQELGVYEDIHEEELHRSDHILTLRGQYIQKGVKLDPYWDKVGRKKTE